MRPLEARAESATQHFVRDDQLAAAQGGGSGSVIGIDVDQLDDPVRITTGSARKQLRPHGAAERNRSLQWRCLP
jgi:hypothetical protein